MENTMENATDNYELLTGITFFAMYFGIAILFLIIFKTVYGLATPHAEWKLIKEDKNTAAAIGFGGAIIGFSAALAGAVSNSGGLIDFAIWGVIALIAQVIAFSVVRFVFMPKISLRIENNEVSAGIVLGATNVAVGLINAACMSY
ncbi:MAG: putative membrane protein [Alphaproteobacteria bacterium]|jgi:putative membrane protein